MIWLNHIQMLKSMQKKPFSKIVTQQYMQHKNMQNNSSAGSIAEQPLWQRGGGLLQLDSNDPSM